MPCPCEGNGNIDEDREHVFLRFIGGKDKVGKLRGRWRTYKPGRIYRTLPECANFEAYPYWESATEQEWCDQDWDDEEEESVSSTASDQDDVALSAELPEETTEESPLDVSDGPDQPLESSDGLHSEFATGMTEADLIRGMDDALLKNYILTNGGKVDGRWGRESLLQEALKL